MLKSGAHWDSGHHVDPQLQPPSSGLAPDFHRNDVRAEQAVSNDTSIQALAGSEWAQLGVRHHSADGERGQGFMAYRDGQVRLGGGGVLDLDQRFGWAGDASLHAQGYLIGWPNTVGAGGATSLALEQGTIHVGGYVTLTADRTLKYLGEVASRNPFNDPEHRFEITHASSKTGRGAVGFSPAPLIGIGGRLEVSKGKSTVYRTQLQKSDAEALYKDAQKGRVAHRLQALDAAREAIPWPNLKDPQSLKVGDELVARTSGSISGGIILGGAGRVGITGTMEGTFTVAARRLDAFRVELVFSPEQIKGIGVTAGLPFVSAHATQVMGVAERQGFVFDLREPAAREAYQQALRGDLPAPSPVDVAGISGGQDTIGRDAAELLEYYKQSLPAGVERTILEKSELEGNVKSVAAGLLFLPKESGFYGWMASSSKMRPRQLVTDGEQAWTLTGSVRTRSQQSPFSGRTQTDVVATVHETTDRDSNRELRGIEVGVVSASSRGRADATNHSVIGTLDGDLGLGVGSYQLQHPRADRSIRLRWALSPEGLDVIGQTSPNAFRVLEARHELPEDALQALGRKLRAATQPSEKAGAVRQFIEGHGARGIRALRSLAPDEPLKVDLKNTAYEMPEELARGLELEFSTPLTGRTSRKEVNRRFRRVSHALVRTRAALRELEDDPLMRKFHPDKIEGTRARLQDVEARLERLIAFERLDRRDIERVVNHLEKGGMSHALELRARLLDWRYAQPIRPTDGKEAIKQQIHDISGWLAEARKERADLRRDFEYQRAAPRSYGDALARLEASIAGLEQRMSFRHLSADDRQSIWNQFEVKHHGLTLWQSHRSQESSYVLGALNALGHSVP